MGGNFRGVCPITGRQQYWSQAMMPMRQSSQAGSIRSVGLGFIVRLYAFFITQSGNGGCLQPHVWRCACVCSRIGRKWVLMKIVYANPDISMSTEAFWGMEMIRFYFG